MKLVRKLHLWFGMLFAPSIMFFAFSGALQILGLHEGDGGSAWIARLALIHKDQLLSAPSRPPRPAEVEAPKRPPEAAAAKPARERAHPSQPLKLFFLLMAAGLMLSTGLGIYMAFGPRRDRTTVIVLLVAGTVIPIIALWL